MYHISPHHYVHVINELLRLSSVNVCWDRIALTSQLRTLKLRSHKVYATVNVLIYWISDIQTQMLDWTYPFMIYLYTQLMSE